MLKFNKPTLITISGPTGSGKTHLHQHLINEGFVTKACSITTRTQRQNEREGIDYNFISEDEVNRLIEQDVLVEHNVYLGNHYGMTKESFLNYIYSDKPLAIIVDPNGVQSYEKICRNHNLDILRIFVQTRHDNIIERLNHRYISEAGDVERLLSERVRNRKEDDPKFIEACEMYERDIISAREKHQARLMNLRNEESRWLTMYNWDAIVFGDESMDKAMPMIFQAANLKNQRTKYA